MSKLDLDLYRKLVRDEVLLKGDIITITSFVCVQVHQVVRVTKKYAIVKYNDTAEGKFPIIFKALFSSLPRDKYDTKEYVVYRKRV